MNGRLTIAAPDAVRTAVFSAFQSIRKLLLNRAAQVSIALHETEKDLWGEAKSKFILETDSMKPEVHDYYSAIEQFLPEIISAIHQAPYRKNVSREQVFELEKMVRNIEFLKPTSTTDVMSTFDQIQNHRIALRSKFGEIYPRLDEVVLK